MGGMKSVGLPDAGIGGDVGIPGEAFSAPLSSSGSFLEGISSGGLQLSDPVGLGAINNPNDVFQVESALSGADILGRPPGRVFGDDTFGAIKAVQGRLNVDSRLDFAKSPLRVDGPINPDGPTQAATRTLAGDVLSKRAPSIPKLPTPSRLPGVSPAKSPLPGVPSLKSPLKSPLAPSTPSASPANLVPTPTGLKRETLEQTVKRFTSKPPLSPAPAIPKTSLTGGRRRNWNASPAASEPPPSRAR
jgi:hypothetical protein